MSQRIPKVTTTIKSVQGKKTSDHADNDTEVVFNFSADFEEIKRKSDSVSLRFKITMGTEPSVATFALDGVVDAEAEPREIEKLLSANPETGVPEIFTKIYQQVYSVLFVLASMIGSPYPSPGLLKKAHIERE